MLHLQSGALVQAKPVIVYSLTNPDGLTTPDPNDTSIDIDIDYSTPELNTAETTASTFTVTRTPAGYTDATDATVEITRTANSNSDDPDNFVVTVDGTVVTGSAGVWTQPITFDSGQNSKAIVIEHDGNDAPNDDYIYTINVAPDTIPGSGSRQLTFTIEDDDESIDLLALDIDIGGVDSSVIAETAVELEGGVQQFIEVYPAGTDSADILTEVGVLPGTFSIEQIMLTVTVSNGVVVVTDDVTNDGTDDGKVIIRNGENVVTGSGSFSVSINGNEFTFDGGTGVAIEDAEAFLELLQFGIVSDEPTGPVDLALTAAAIRTVGTGPEAADTETANRAITVEDDPIELVGLADGESFTLQNSEVEADATITIDLSRANDGGDDSGIMLINPTTTTFSRPTAENLNVMGTLTLSSLFEPLSGLSGSPEGRVTLTVNSDVLLAPTSVVTDLIFSAGRESVTRTITIEIIERGIDLVLAAIDDSDIPEMTVEDDLIGQQYTRIYDDAIPSDTIITEIGVAADTFTITQIELTITGGNGDAVVMNNSSPFTRTESGNVFTFSNSGGVAISDAGDFLKSLRFGINNDEPTGFPTGVTTPTFSVDVTVALAVTAIDADSEEADDTETVVRTINEENDPVWVGTVPTAATVQVGELFVASNPTSISVPDIENIHATDGGDDSGEARDNSGLDVDINPDTISVPRRMVAEWKH